MARRKEQHFAARMRTGVSPRMVGNMKTGDKVAKEEDEDSRNMATNKGHLAHIRIVKINPNTAIAPEQAHKTQWEVRKIGKAVMSTKITGNDQNKVTRKAGKKQDQPHIIIRILTRPNPKKPPMKPSKTPSP